MLIGPSQLYGIQPSLTITVVGLFMAGLFTSSIFVPAYPEVKTEGRRYALKDGYTKIQEEKLGDMAAGLVTFTFTLFVFAGIIIGN